ncbi:hypothetical protein MAR_019855 [Mya arenaria]|uniref:Uncharacterized protein n=1 Tax=Mya arenaria TaxID=6604 RepID=A0ABY7E7E6_MYAAR|nr:hypothetical protein MAR_019855 [Mya arenaria]
MDMAAEEECTSILDAQEEFIVTFEISLPASPKLLDIVLQLGIRPNFQQVPDHLGPVVLGGCPVPYLTSGQ